MDAPGRRLPDLFLIVPEILLVVTWDTEKKGKAIEAMIKGIIFSNTY